MYTLTQSYNTCIRCKQSKYSIENQSYKPQLNYYLQETLLICEEKLD